MIFDRGEITCSFAAIDSPIGSVFLSQIISRYPFTNGHSNKFSVSDIFQFIRINITDLVADFTSVKAGKIPPRLEQVQFTPPLDILSKIAKANLSNHRRNR